MSDIEHLQQQLDVEQQFRKALFDGLISPAFVLNSEFQILEANPAARQLMAPFSEELIGNKCHRLLHLSDEPPDGCPAKIAFDTKQPTTAEMPVEAFGRKFCVTCLPIPGDDGQSQMIHLLTDSTEEIGAKEALQESEERFQFLLDHVPVAYQSLDGDGCFLHVNETWLTCTGYERKDVIGKSFGDFLHPDWVDHFKANFPKFKSVGEVMGVEFEIRRADDRFITVSYTGKIGHNSMGEFLQTHCIFDDITMRREAESALGRYQRIVSASRDLMSLVNATDTYLSANDAYAQAFGKPLDAIVGTTVESLYGNAFYSQVLKPQLELCRNGIPVNFQEWFDFPVLGRRLMDVNYYPDSNGGRASFVVVNARDITENRLLEDQLFQARKMESIGTLAGGIAHEFNNILGIILGNCELAEDGVAPGHFSRPHLDEIHNACLRAKGVVRQLLDFSRKSRTNRKPVPLTPVVADTLKLIRSTVPANVIIETRYNIYRDIVAADVVQIEQMLINLCTNAAHALHATGGTVTIELDARTITDSDSLAYQGAIAGEYVRLRVADDGCGIPDEHLDRIFDPYFTTRDVGQGTGMGLAVVHSIVRQHGGALRVVSQPNHGTRISILLPQVDDPAESSVVASPEPGSVPLRHVLIVDDEPQLVNLMRVVLEHEGYTVSSFTDPHQAMDLFNSAPKAIDAVVTDMTMPGLTGDVLARQIHEMRPDMPVIICTGHSELLSEQDLSRVGVRDILLKPVSRNDLLEALSDLK